MDVTTLAIADVLLLTPAVHRDERGFVVESWQQARLDAALGHPVRFVQDNRSRSRPRVLRGLHYQVGAAAQGKLVSVARGRIFDVAVDLRRGSASFGRWVGAELDDVRAQALWIPPGFAHGFLVLGDQAADVCYKLTAPHDPAAARFLRWDDPALGIAWPAGEGEPLLSARDAAAPGLHGAEPS